MSRKYRALVASCVAIVGVGVSATVAIGDSEDPAPVQATTLPRSLAVPASVERAAANPEFGEFGVRAADAVRVSAPAAAQTENPWWIVPADHGACVSPGTGGLVCGTVAQLEAGQILFVELPLRPLGASGPMVDAANPVRIAGLVPDGVAVVVATAGDGRELGRANVHSNVYEIPFGQPSAARSSSGLGAIELRRPDGTEIRTLRIGSN